MTDCEELIHTTAPRIQRQKGDFAVLAAAQIRATHPEALEFPPLTEEEVDRLADDLAAFFKKGAGAIAATLLLFITGTAHAAIDAEIPALIQTIVKAESSGNARAIGDGGKARGLMQIQEATWKRHTREPWSRAFEAKLNRTIGEKEIRRIIRTYRARGIEPSKAHIIWTYNTGSFIKHSLPAKDKAGRPHPWTTNHPNNTYRAIYLEYFRRAA